MSIVREIDAARIAFQIDQTALRKEGKISLTEMLLDEGIAIEEMATLDLHFFVYDQLDTTIDKMLATYNGEEFLIHRVDRGWRVARKDGYARRNDWKGEFAPTGNLRPLLVAVMARYV